MKSDPKELAVIATKQRVLNLAIQGFDVRGIAQSLGIAEETVREHVVDIRADLTLRMQEAQEIWVAMNVARTEKILSKIMPIFDEVEMPPIKATYGDGEMSLQSYVSLVGDAAKIFTSIAKLQKEILQIKLETNNPAAKFVQNNTILANSDFYEEALKAMQRDLFGKTWEEAQEEAAEYIDVIPALDEDPRISRIESAVSKLIPANNDDPAE